MLDKNRVTEHYTLKTYGGVDVEVRFFLTSALFGGEWSASRPACFAPGERVPGTHWIGGWVGPRTGLDDMEKWKFFPPPGLELRPLGRPARSQSLYRLRYPEKQKNHTRITKNQKVNEWRKNIRKQENVLRPRLSLSKMFLLSRRYKDFICASC
jgi:2-polyprenyl-6-methoxyphenol hydroxylase-like FAD-dependent oxidoreductase